MRTAALVDLKDADVNERQYKQSQANISGEGGWRSQISLSEESGPQNVGTSRGDLVLVIEPNMVRGQWPLGKASSSQCYGHRGTCGKGEDCKPLKAISTPTYQASCVVHREKNTEKQNSSSVLTSDVVFFFQIWGNIQESSFYKPVLCSLPIKYYYLFSSIEVMS